MCSGEILLVLCSTCHVQTCSLSRPRQHISKLSRSQGQCFLSLSDSLPCRTCNVLPSEFTSYSQEFFAHPFVVPGSLPASFCEGMLETPSVSHTRGPALPTIASTMAFDSSSSGGSIIKQQFIIVSLAL